MKSKGFGAVTGSPEEIRAYWEAENRIDPAEQKLPKVTLPARVSTNPLEIMQDIRRLVDLIDTVEILTHTDLGDLHDWLQSLRDQLHADLDRLEDIK